MEFPRGDVNPIRLVSGLGNPGDEYRNTRHNVGFMVIEKLLAMWQGRFEESGIEQSRCFTGRFRGKPLTLQMPQTFMNLSGEAVGGLCRRLKLQAENLLVIVDDMDLPVGKLRLRASGSAGGHNGLKSIISNLGTEKFARLRIGIGRPQGKTVDYVLSAPEGEDAAAVEAAVNNAAEAVKTVLTEGITVAMNKFNATVAEEEKSNQTNL